MGVRDEEKISIIDLNSIIIFWTKNFETIILDLIEILCFFVAAEWVYGFSFSNI